LPSLIRAIRVLGVMIGVDLPFDASTVVAESLKRKLLINATHGHVVRLLPALTITDEQIDEGCAILADVLRQAA
jgi:acetylornithine/N-succinyldiaminopimelate aminotransferase